MKLNKFKSFLPYIIVIFAITAPWFFKSGYLFFTDFIWGPNVVLDWTNGWLIFNLVVKFLSFIFPLDFVQKIIISFTLLVALLGGKKLTEQFIEIHKAESSEVCKVESNKWLVFVISLFALFNPFVYDRVMYGQIGTVLAFGFLCFSVGYLLEYLRKRETRQVLLAGLFIGLTVQFSIHFVFFVGVFYALFILLTITPNSLSRELTGKKSNRYVAKLFYAVLADSFAILVALLRRLKPHNPQLKLGRKFSQFLTLFYISVLIAVIIIALNFNWIFAISSGTFATGNFASSAIQMQDLTAFQTAGETSVDVIKNVSMMSGFWGKDQFRYVDLTKQVDNWGRSFFLLLPIILLGAMSMLRSGNRISIDYKCQMSNVKCQMNPKLQIPNLSPRGIGDYKSQTNPKLQISAYGGPATGWQNSKQLKYLAIGLIIIYIIAVVLAVGIRVPIAREIAYWLFDNFPFYKGLREPQKWVAVIVIVYTVFLAVGAKELFKTKIVAHNKFLAKVFLSGIIIMQAPLLLFGLNGQVEPMDYPKDWYEANNYIVENYKSQIPNLSPRGIGDSKQITNSKFQITNSNCNGKILFLPWHMYMSFYWLGHIVANPARAFFSCPVISGTNMEWGGIYDNSLSEEGKLIGKWLALQGKNDLLSKDKLDIKYIILAKELDWQSYLWMDNDPEIEFIKDTEILRVYRIRIMNSES